MKIEKITKLKNGIYELLIINDNNEEQKFKLSEGVLIEHNLYSNKVVSKNDLELLNELANYSKIYTSTLNFISFKMRSEHEVIEYLNEKKCSEKLIKEIIIKLKNLNYINDQIYCDAYVKYQFDTNKKGKNSIQADLIKKGIDQNYIHNSLNYIQSDQLTNNINLLINYYLKINKNKTIRKIKETIIRNLMVKGYDYDDIVTCLNNFDFHDSQDDTELIKKEFHKVYTKYQKKVDGIELKNKVIKTLMNKGFNYEDILNRLNDINDVNFEGD